MQLMHLGKYTPLSPDPVCARHRRQDYCFATQLARSCGVRAGHRTSRFYQSGASVSGKAQPQFPIAVQVTSLSSAHAIRRITSASWKCLSSRHVAAKNSASWFQRWPCACSGYEPRSAATSAHSQEEREEAIPTSSQGSFSQTSRYVVGSAGCLVLLLGFCFTAPTSMAVDAEVMSPQAEAAGDAKELELSGQEDIALNNFASSSAARLDALAKERDALKREKTRFLQVNPRAASNKHSKLDLCSGRSLQGSWRIPSSICAPGDR
ncbi:hypothetical protein CYMTET_33033 [Cymbomonas tetramitiformis]|uniref:Uncharacterized protein n=1 Tax=Cymbomonas tetramitiformis TaxID=36881 RepID=A0AAE0FE84_9CHLO|nr:hypothetical protein CYMTET_33033 [Cymbomonas tetramitiformis]